MRSAPTGFEDYRAAAGSRTAGQILAHIGDLFDWALSLAQGQQVWHDSTPLGWEAEVARFFTALQRLDDRLASGEALGNTADRLFQGPVADALTHVGQLTMLRRLAGSPVRGENYFTADITAGRVSADQSAPTKEFD